LTPISTYHSLFPRPLSLPPAFLVAPLPHSLVSFLPFRSHLNCSVAQLLNCCPPLTPLYRPCYLYSSCTTRHLSGIIVNSAQECKIKLKTLTISDVKHPKFRINSLQRTKRPLIKRYEFQKQKSARKTRNMNLKHTNYIYKIKHVFCKFDDLQA
jgi:hypothetical protein